MATSKMIEAAARGPAKPGVSPTVQVAANAALHQPRGSHDDAESAAAARMMLRMLLGRHDCPQLPACEAHGRAVCDCRPCSDPRHADDALRVREALTTFGLAEEARITHLTCSTCHKPKAVSQFSGTAQTCKSCLSEKKAAREASLEAS